MEDNRMVSFSLGGMAFEYDDNKNQINFANSSCVRLFFLRRSRTFAPNFMFATFLWSSYRALLM